MLVDIKALEKRRDTIMYARDIWDVAFYTRRDLRDNYAFDDLRRGSLLSAIERIASITASLRDDLRQALAEVGAGDDPDFAVLEEDAARALAAARVEQ